MIIDKYKTHPIIILIKQFCKDDFSFCFQFVEMDGILNKIRSLDATKCTQETDILTKIITGNEELLANFVHAVFNECLESGDFVSFLKWIDVIPISK